ncbi:OmpA family protein [Thiopseudomonas alkaliphila]|uniref:OmpA family protein n=1 Tax=Thiopseudomonas alkaliphila TaxID=1697053 RepID=UPI00069ECDCB|nr:OmpA family protein [Thiopseudomonas alkaliphila]
MRLLWNALLLSLTIFPYNAVKAANSNDKVVVSGTVADNATKTEILSRLRELYGADLVVDSLEVSSVTTPANWDKFITNMIQPDIKKISKGEISVTGNTVELKGLVNSELARQQILNRLANTFNKNYNITGSLEVVNSKQEQLNAILENQTIEFESGKDVLTASSEKLLDEISSTIKKINTPLIQIVGNTDNIGNRNNNILLSLNRAIAAKAYLVKRGVPAETLSVSGMGPDNPIASNATKEGQARNRRIDFIILDPEK